MPIVKDGNGVIQYTPQAKEREFEETGVVLDTDFAIADTNNVLKQIQWQINPTTTGPGILTIQVDVAGDSSVNLTDLGNDITAQTANKVFSGPSSGPSAVPTFRSLVLADIPSLPYISSTLTNSHILVGNGSNIATDVAVSGDIALANTGAMTVSTVGSSSAANVHAAELLANASTSANTVSTIVRRDASGNFSVGTITGNLTGNASGTSANVTGTVAIANGGTGQTSANAGFNALSPMTTLGDSIYGGASGIGTRLAGNTAATRKFLRQLGDSVNSAAPAWDTIVSGDIPTLNQNTTGTAVNVTGVVAIVNGGTGQATKTEGFDALAPTTTLGDTIYYNGSDNVRIAGNTTSTKKFYTQTGDGVNSASPGWNTIATGDVPTLNQNTSGTASNVTGTVAIANGGTGQTSKAAGFDALSPMTTSGDVIYGGASGTGTRLGKGSDGQVLTLASGLPSWATPASTAPNAEIALNTNNGYGAVATAVVRWTTIGINNGGSDISYADSANNGGIFTINTTGIYSVEYWLDLNTVAGTSALFLSVNGAAAGPYVNNGGLGFGTLVSYVKRFVATDTIKAVVAGGSTQSSGSTQNQGFRVIRIA